MPPAVRSSALVGSTTTRSSKGLRAISSSDSASLKIEGFCFVLIARGFGEFSVCDKPSPRALLASLLRPGRPKSRRPCHPCPCRPYLPCRRPFRPCRDGGRRRPLL